MAIWIVAPREQPCYLANLMRILELPEIRRALDYGEIIDRMRDALIAYSRGECEMPMPMHLDIAPVRGEVHIKSSYRRGGKFFALKMASTFPENAVTGNGMMLLASAQTGEPVALLSDAGHLTDVRTAAVAAMAARELERKDTAIGILGTGVQARLQARLHAEVLPLERIVLWGRNRERAEACARELSDLAAVSLAGSAAEVAREARLIVTTTAARAPLLRAEDIRPGTLISAVGSDSPGKQELDPEILHRAIVLADSRRQCEKLGELQHAPGEWTRAMELGRFCEAFELEPPDSVVCDFTGLGVEDLYIAEYCYERSGN
jgi:ornithine cyclodeaminase